MEIRCQENAPSIQISFLEGMSNRKLLVSVAVLIITAIAYAIFSLLDKARPIPSAPKYTAPKYTVPVLFTPAQKEALVPKANEIFTHVHKVIKEKEVLIPENAFRSSGSIAKLNKMEKLFLEGEESQISEELYNSLENSITGSYCGLEVFSLIKRIRNKLPDNFDARTSNDLMSIFYLVLTAPDSLWTKESLAVAFPGCKEEILSIEIPSELEIADK